MRYWDSSAIIPLIVEQAATDHLRQAASSDPAIVTWWGTRIECVSALARLERANRLASGIAPSIAQLRRAASTWAEMSPSQDLREQAMRLLRVHDLRAGDAVQLAAAIVACDFQPAALDFVTLDVRQAEAAEKEGFRVIG